MKRISPFPLLFKGKGRDRVKMRKKPFETASSKGASLQRKGRDRVKVRKGAFVTALFFMILNNLCIISFIE